MTDKDYVPYGSDVSSGTYRCVDCGYEISHESISSLPPCPNTENSPHPKKGWEVTSGQGDAKQDPYA